MVSYGGRIGVCWGLSGMSGTIDADPGNFPTGKLCTVIVFNRISNGNPGVPTSVVGPSGLSFTRISALDHTFGLNTVDDTRMSVWVALGNGSTGGAVTINFGVSQTDGFASADYWSAGTNFTDAINSIRQAIKNSGASANDTGSALNLAALRDADSMAVAAVMATPQANIALTNWSGATALFQAGHGTPLDNVSYAACKSNSIAAAVTFQGGVSQWGGVAFEILEPGGAPPDPPTNTVAPVISGTAMENEVLSCSTGTWTGSPSLEYQWQKDTAENGVFADIDGATSNQYTLTSAEIDDDIRCVVTGTNGGGSADANSNTLGPVIADTMADWETTRTIATATTEDQWLTIGDYVVSVYYESGSIKYRVSNNEGVSFGTPVVVDSQSGDNDVMLNDAIAYDEIAGRLHLLYGRNVDVGGLNAELCHRYTDNPFAATPTFSSEHVIDNGVGHGYNRFYRVAMWANNSKVSIHYTTEDNSVFTTDGLWRALSSNGGTSFGAKTEVYTGTVVGAYEPNCYGLPDGTVVVSWYDDETNTNQAGDVWICRSANDGATWDASATKLTTGKGWGRTRIKGENGIWWIVGNKPWNSGSPNSDVYTIHSTDNAQNFGAPVLRIAHGSDNTSHPDIFIRGSFIGIIVDDMGTNPKSKRFIYSIDDGATFSSPVNAYTVSTGAAGDAPRLLGTTTYLIAKGYDTVTSESVWSRVLLPESAPGPAPIVSAGTGWTKRKLNLSSTGTNPRNQSSEYKIASTTDPVTATFDLDESTAATVAIVAYKVAAEETAVSGWGIPI